MLDTSKAGTNSRVQVDNKGATFIVAAPIIMNHSNSRHGFAHSASSCRSKTPSTRRIFKVNVKQASTVMVEARPRTTQIASNRQR
jgi:hypothetical protein